MKKTILISAIAAATIFQTLAHANSVIIEFTGDITAATCTVNGGPGRGTPTNIPINMGKVSIADLSDGSGTDFGSEVNINIEVDCSSAIGVTGVSMRFAPRSGSGVNPVNSRLLATRGGATGVGIGLIDSDNALIDLGGTALSLPVNLDITPGTPPTATAKMVIRAAYIRATRGSDVATPGSANGTLPFTLSYI